MERAVITYRFLINTKYFLCTVYGSLFVAKFNDTLIYNLRSGPRKTHF